MSLSNFPQGAAPQLILKADFSKCTLGAPTFVTAKNYNQTVTFSDLDASAMTAFFGTSYAFLCQSIIDRSATDATDFISTIENSIVTVPGPFGADVSVLYQNIKNKTLNPGTNPSGAPNQTWFKIQRAVQAGGVAPAAIDSMYVSYWQKLQVAGAPPLDQFLAYGDPSQAAFWLSLYEYKKGFITIPGITPLRSGAGDARFMFRTDEDADGLHFLTRWDNSADNVPNPPGVPGVTVCTPADNLIVCPRGPNGEIGGKKTFFAQKSRTPLPQSDSWFRTEVFIEKGREQRRTQVAITPASTMKRNIICDLFSPVDLLGSVANNGAQAGIYGDDSVWSQMFFGGKYADSLPANYPLNGYIYDLQIWDRPPHMLEAPLFSTSVLLGVLHGPQSYTPTAPTGVVKYVSPTGTGDGATIGNPMSIVAANNSAMPGDHFWLRDGVYTIPLNGIRFYDGGTSWNPGEYVTYESYPGEQAIFDGAANQADEADVRVKMQGFFTCLRKIEIRNCSLQGVQMTGTDNKVEFCEIHDCWLSGIAISVSGGYPYANGRNIVRCNTIYNCSDVLRTGPSYANGGNADAISVSSGIRNIVEYNLCFHCSDDGIDVWRSTETTVWGNIVYNIGLGDGNGNCYKCGGSPGGVTMSTDHVFAYNLAIGGTGNGFSQNNGVRVTFYHNTSALNGGEGFSDLDSTAIVTGNISADTVKFSGSKAGHSLNSWDVVNGPEPDFISTTIGSSFYYKPLSGHMFANIGAYAA